jgi:hypothetical protein
MPECLVGSAGGRVVGRVVAAVGSNPEPAEKRAERLALIDHSPLTCTFVTEPSTAGALTDPVS